MNYPWWFSQALALTLAVTALAIPTDLEFSATAFDRGDRLQIRLVAEGDLARDAVAARPVIRRATCRGKRLKELDADSSTMETELDRPDGGLVTWIDLERPSGEVSHLDVADGHLEVLAGGADRALHGTGFRNEKLKEIKSSEFSDAEMQVSACIRVEPALRLDVRSKGSSITKLSLEGARVFHASSTEVEYSRLTAHVDAGRLPEGSSIFLEVRDSLGGQHSFKITGLRASWKPQPIKIPGLDEAGVELTLSRINCNHLFVVAEGPGFRIRDVGLVDRGTVLASEIIMKTPSSTGMEVEQAYGSIPSDSKLLIVLREGAKWTEAPFQLRALPIN